MLMLTYLKLIARRGSLPNTTNDTWTAFVLELREPTPIPSAFDFARFLASSITFMAHLREVSVYFDDKRLVHLAKDAGAPQGLNIPRGLTPAGTFMNIERLESTREWPIGDQVHSALTIITPYSPAYYRGNHELGLQCWDRAAQTSPCRTNQAQGRLFLPLQAGRE